MKTNILEDLFHQELRNLYSAEKQLLKVVAKMAGDARHPKLQALFNARLQETEGQIQRLEQTAALLGKSLGVCRCPGIEQMLQEGESLILTHADDATHDASLIAAAQHFECYEIEGYCMALTLAARLGMPKMEALLEKNLKEERAAAARLARMAQSLKYRTPTVRGRRGSEYECFMSFPSPLLCAGAAF